MRLYFLAYKRWVNRQLYFYTEMEPNIYLENCSGLEITKKKMVL